MAEGGVILDWDTSKIIAAVDAGVRDGLADAGRLIQEAARDNLNGKVLNVRSGNLRRSVTTVEGKDAQGRFVLIGTGVRYAAVHEYGARINAKTAKNLAIPLDAALTKRGNLRSFSQPGKDDKGNVSLKNMPGLKFIKLRNGKKFLVREVTKGRKGNKKTHLEFLFVLKPFVDIPARPWLRPAFNENVDRARTIIGEAVAKRLQRFGL